MQETMMIQKLSIQVGIYFLRNIRDFVIILCTSGNRNDVGTRGCT